MHSNLYKILIISILSISTSNVLFSQGATLKGVIFDKEENEPLISATISNQDNTGVVTDFDGKYEISLTPGKHKIEFSYVGYQTISQEVDLTDGEVKELNIELGFETNLLKTATVTSGKYEKPLAETTISIEVIKPRLLESTNSTSVDDLLNKIPGVTLVDNQPNIRGGSGWSYGAGSRVLLLLDDIPALQADAGLAQWDDLPVENIAQIEVVKGAASALYGSSALNGIINVRTAYATSTPVTKFSTFYTMYDDPKDISKIWWDSISYNADTDTYKKESNKFSDQPHEFGFSFAHRQKIKKLDLVLGGFYFNRSSFREFTYSRYGRISVGTRYRVNDNLTFGFNSNFNPGESSSFFLWRNGDEGAYRPLEIDGAFSESSRFRYTIDPFVTYFDNSGNRHRLTGRFYHVDNQNNDNRSNVSELFYGEYQFQKKWEDKNIVMSTGLVSTFTNIEAELYGDTTYRSRNLAAYVQLEKKFFDKLNISAGARFEQNNTKSPEFINSGGVTDTIPNGKITEGKPVFRVGANYQLSETTYIRSSWGQGYRYPTIAEQFIFTNAGGLTILPNPSLTSETGWTSEIGIKQGFRISKWNGFIDIAGFWSEYQRMMEFQSLGLDFATQSINFKSDNIGDIKITGMEVSASGIGKIKNVETYLIAGYTFINPIYKDFDEETQLSSSSDKNVLKYRNKHSFKFDLEFKYKKFSIGGGYIFNSEVEAIDLVLESFGEIGKYREENDGGYSLIDFRTSYELFKDFKMSFIAKNLLNEEYMVRPGTLEAPRQLTLRLDYKF